MHKIEVSDDVLDIVHIVHAIESGKDDLQEERDETYKACERLSEAVKAMLDNLDIDGTCQICEMGFNFHSTDCAIHAVNVALDRIDY